MDRTLVALARKASARRPATFDWWRGFCTPSSPSLNSKLFVGGLSWSVDEKSLLDAFSSFGEVSEVKILYDKDSGRTRGFGFVSFAKEDDAISAKDAMDGKALLGRPLRISYALEKVRGAPVVVSRLPGTGSVTSLKD
ncbi:glycine-rich RNA-binding protein 4, mitochondrial-like [Punica granatum]|uniref:RRM domain-containing protein n=2 Tax=Punica granatum TaxID=22663 RepID=A0A218X477_PUNGR|nr:glycine-rich RNA-binding protein 4, mitochondrial-like [Punica granatum]OWM79797.1 hypothetical protein CDL15_Pgr023209 [Punica granatum]PKI54357.1 hypothetical protein CRG98_025243 [Punica granatum]